LDVDAQHQASGARRGFHLICLAVGRQAGARQTAPDDGRNPVGEGRVAGARRNADVELTAERRPKASTRKFADADSAGAMVQSKSNCQEFG
jgi:hypothetical protein